MLNLSDQVVIQIFNTTINVAMLIAILRAARSVNRLEFKVEMMWQEFSKRIGMSDFKDKG